MQFIISRAGLCDPQGPFQGHVSTGAGQGMSQNSSKERECVPWKGSPALPGGSEGGWGVLPAPSPAPAPERQKRLFGAGAGSNGGASVSLQ